MTFPASVELSTGGATAVGSPAVTGRAEDTEGATEFTPAVSALLEPQAEVRKIVPTKTPANAAFATGALLTFRPKMLNSLERIKGYLFLFDCPHSGRET